MASKAARLLPYDYKAQNALWDSLRQLGKNAEAEQQRERMEILYERRNRQSEIRRRLLAKSPTIPLCNAN